MRDNEGSPPATNATSLIVIRDPAREQLNPELATTRRSLRPPRSPEARDRALLVRLEGAEAGRPFRIRGDSVTIGRHASNDLQLPQDGVSRHHARISLVEGRYVVEDLGSTNGTFIASRRIAHAVLAEADCLQIGPAASFWFTLTEAVHERLLGDLYVASALDALTGCANRRYFDSRFVAEVALRQSDATPLGMLLVDVDHFKSLNDELGHAAGDSVLRSIARRMQSRLGPDDLLARFGGEEFAILLPAADLTESASIAEELRVAIARDPIKVGDRPIRVTVSIGCATLGCCELPSAERLLALADARLYSAKRAGRNRVRSAA